MRPRWLAGVLFGKRRTLGNLATFFPERGIGELSEWMGGQFDPSITWNDVAWVRDRWPGKLIAQGHSRCRGCALARRDRRRCHRRVQSRRTAARWRHVDDRRVAARRRRRGGRCEVLLDGGITRAGRAQGAGARRARLSHRQSVSLWSRRARRARRLTRARHHSRASSRSVDGAHRRAGRRNVGAQILAQCSACA